MVVNNFEQICNLLTFESEDDFYHLQILKRKKDCAEHDRAKNNNARCIKTYYIKNKEYLLSKEKEIISLCELFTARAYINLNKKSFKKASILAVAEITNRIIQNQEEYVYRAYESVVGDSKVNVGEKRWIIDIDTKDEDILGKTLWEICRSESQYLVHENETGKFYANVITKIPTVNGYHIITHPFNLKQIEPFRCIHPFDVQKNNPTLLYFNKKEDADKG